MTGMIEWGQKSKPKQIPGPKFNPQKSHAEFPSYKNFQKALNDITITNLQIILNAQKNPYLNKAAKKILAKIFLPKTVPKSKILNPKKSFHHPCHLKSGVSEILLMLVRQKGRNSCLRLRPRSDFSSFGVVLMSCKVIFHVVRSALQNSVSTQCIFLLVRSFIDPTFSGVFVSFYTIKHLATHQK